jgi:hypothetical protein
MGTAWGSNSYRQQCFAVTLLLLAIVCPQTHCQQIIVKHFPDAAAAVVKQASRLRLLPVAQTPGLTVLRNQGKTQLQSAKVEQLLERARSWPGVQYAEQDLPRYMHLPSVEQQQGPAGARTAEQQQRAECREKSIPLTDSPVPEYQVSSGVLLVVACCLSRVPHGMPYPA